MRITKILALILALIMVVLSVPVTAENTKDIDLIESTNNYINGSLDSFGLTDTYYSYEEFNDTLDGHTAYNNFCYMANDVTDGKLNFEPEVEDYVETISNMIAITESENPDDISAQKQLDHLKEGADYVKDAIDICVDAYSLVSSFSDDDTVELISDVIETVDTLCDNTENAVTLISNIEAATEQYVRYDRILQQIEENSEGKLNEAAAIMRKSLNSYYNYALGEYCDLAADGVYDMGSSMFDFGVEEFKKTLSKEDLEVFELLDDFNILKDSFELGVEGALFVGNVILGTEDMAKRVREMKTVSELSDALEKTVLEEKEAFLLAYEKGEATRELCENYLDTVDYLHSNRRRGEYCLYALMNTDMRLFTWFTDKKELDDWYNKFLNFISERDTLLEKAKVDPEVLEIHRYQVFDGVAKNWQEAEAYCRSLGGHLVTIGGYEENMHVFNLMKDAGYESAYIGLYETESGAWKWCNGEPVIFTNWGGKEPNNEGDDENFGMFYYKFPDGHWNDGDFNGTIGGGKAFICEWDE